MSTRKHVFVEKLEKYQYFLVTKVPYLGLKVNHKESRSETSWPSGRIMSLGGTSYHVIFQRDSSIRLSAEFCLITRKCHVMTDKLLICTSYSNCR